MLATITSLFIPIFVYEVPTHQVISRLAAVRSTHLQRELGEFEWSTVDHSGSAYTALQTELAKFAGTGIAIEGSTPVDLIGKGGVTEDYFVKYSPSTWRFLNHFLDGVSKSGLDVLVSGLPSDQWGCCAGSNHYRWAEANYWYEQALLAHTEAEREDARIRLFRSLGQVIHLVQDAFQPSHSRNDSHSHIWGGIFDGGSELELWGLGAVTPGSVDPQVAGGLASAGVASGSTLQQFFYDAAEFSNRYFFSDDTIYQNLDEPPYAAPSDTDTYTGNESVPVLFGFEQDYEFIYSDTVQTPQGAPMRLARGKRSILDLFGSTDENDYTLAVSDNRIVRDNASTLLRGALSSSTGVLDYFFRGDLQLAIKTVDGEGRLEVQNVSAAPGSGGGLALGAGELNLYYETVEGTLQPVPGFASTQLSGLGYAQAVLLEGDLVTTMLELSLETVPAPFRAVEDRTVRAVFDGSIGLEHGICASLVDVKGFRIVDFEGSEFILDDGTPADLSFTWEGDPVFPVTFRWDKQTCNTAFWSDCDDDEAFSWLAIENPLELQLFITGCATTTEFVGGEVWLSDATGQETQRVPWSVSAIFVGSQCLPATGGGGGSGSFSAIGASSAGAD